MRGAAVCALMLIASAGAAYAKARVVAIEEPKQFGYFIGDVLKRVVLIEHSEADQLVTASLAEPGQIKYWLWLRSIKTEALSRQGRSFLRVHLAYQTFYAPLQPQRLAIPRLRLTFRGDIADSEATIPPFTFLAAPLRELTTPQGGEGRDDTGEIPQLMPDTQPKPLSTANERTAMLLSSAAAVLALGLLFYHLAWWPFNARPYRPFTVAARRIAALTRSAIADDKAALRDTIKPAYLAMHRALDETAGRRLLASDQGELFSEHLGLASRREEVERFFEASRALFFAEDAKRAEAIMPLGELADLSGDLAFLERSQL